MSTPTANLFKLFYPQVIHSASRRFYHTLKAGSRVFSIFLQLFRFASLSKHSKPRKAFRHTLLTPIHRADTPVQYRNEVRKWSAKVMAGIFKVFIFYHGFARVSREIWRNFAFFGVNSSEARWFRVPPPEVPTWFFINKSHFLLTRLYTSDIIYSYKKGEKCKD